MPKSKKWLLLVSLKAKTAKTALTHSVARKKIRRCSGYVVLVHHCRQNSDAVPDILCILRSVKFTIHSTIAYVRYSFLLVWNSSYFFETRRFSDVRFQKCRYLEIRVRGNSTLLKVVPFDGLVMVSYWCSLVTFSLKCTDFKIFDFKDVLTLKTGLGSVKVIGNITIP